MVLGIICIIFGIIFIALFFEAIEYKEIPYIISFLILAVVVIICGIYNIKQYTKSEHKFKCSEYRIEEEIITINDSIIDKTYIIYYKK